MILVNALPLVLVILLVAVFSFEKIVYLIAFFAPLSIPLHEIVPGFGFDMYLPTGPLWFGLFLLFLLKVIHERGYDKKILLHPVSLAIYVNLLWILLTSVTSTMPIVSIKFLLMRTWFVVGLYFLVVKIFENGNNLEKYVWLYTIGLGLVVLYATIRHLGYGLWDKQAAHFVVGPFYNDHTSYGAVLAMYLPFMVMFSFNSFFSRKMKMISLGFLGIIFLGFILSYSRAAWLSIVVAMGVWGMMKLKIRFKPVLIAFLSVLTIFLVFQTQILMKLEQNSEQSSANMMTHISSMSNITTDASNLERVNRWSCAIRMFSDKPVFGFGPGTYMFKYAPYQLSKDRTIIRTNSADGGNAHSEYLGPMAESGILGLLSYLLIIGVVTYTAVHTYTRLKDVRLKSFVLTSIISLVTYYIHGFLNNFLDSDKAAVPVYGFIGIIVALDLFHNNNKEINT